jgi:hypothetical protein
MSIFLISPAIHISTLSLNGLLLLFLGNYRHGRLVAYKIEAQPAPLPGAPDIARQRSPEPHRCFTCFEDDRLMQVMESHPNPTGMWEWKQVADEMGGWLQPAPDYRSLVLFPQAGARTG